jgi:hypothetical protein
MSKPAKPVFSNDTIALALDELRYHQRGDNFTCAIMRSHGRNFVLARAASLGRSNLFAIDEEGRIYETQMVDGLYSVVDEPDTYHFDD